MLRQLLTGTLALALCSQVTLGGVPEAMDPGERLEKSPRHHEFVDLKTLSGRTVRAFVAFPEVEKPSASVVVIHENRGLNDWARSLADQLAEAGYVAIAPDMLSGKAPGGGDTPDYESSDAAKSGIYMLKQEEVTEALDAAVKYVRDLDSTTDTVAVGGFCWGGGQAFSYAAENADIAAAFVFYGRAPEESELKNVKVPVYGFYGGNDVRISGSVPEVETMMTGLNKTYKPEIYKGAGHGFMRSGEDPDAEEANVQGRNDAWERWLSILADLK